MAIANTDKFLHVGNPGTATTLSSPGYTVGNTSITVASTTNFPTDTAVIFSIDTAATTTGQQVRNTGSYCVFVGIVTGAQTIGSIQLLSGTPQNYAASALTRVYITVSAVHTNRLIDGILSFANQDGSLKQAAVKTALGVTSTTGGGWDILNAGTAPTVATGYNHGNKEYALTFAGVDLTSTLSAGMRLKFDRGTTAPTQSMAFTAASSQYATKASPTGISFTTAFTTEAWIRPSSYVSGGIIGRYDGTNGFYMSLNASGQVVVFTPTKSAVSYQSVSLLRQAHIAATYSAGTINIYINGTLVSSLASGAGVSFTQAGSLQVGAYNSTNFFDGYISEARIWSVAQTATQIQDNMAISLTGSETNLVALFQGNGNFTDKTANGNTLTATGGAIATQAANPYNTTEYAIVTKVAFATGNTTVTVFTGTDYNIPLGTLINPFSSFQKAPFGFNASRGKWLVQSLYLVNTAQVPPTQGTWYNPGTSISIPTGEWRAGYSGLIQNNNASTTSVDANATLSTTNNSQSDVTFTTHTQLNGATGSLNIESPASIYRPLSVTSQANFYLNIAVISNGGGAQVSLSGSKQPTIIEAECAYI